MRLDSHVHTIHAGSATVYPFNDFMRESYNTPQSVYDTAKRRGMDLVTITDHDTRRSITLRAASMAPLTAAHLAAVLPWVDGLEVINRHSPAIAKSHGDVPGGGDSHTGPPAIPRPARGVTESPADWRGYARTFGGPTVSCRRLLPSVELE